MSLAVSPARRSRWVQASRHLRTAAPYVLLGVLAVVVWWAGAWLLPFALFGVAAWRAPDPEQVRVAVELLAAALVLALTALALLIRCARGRIR